MRTCVSHLSDVRGLDLKTHMLMMEIWGCFIYLRQQGRGERGGATGGGGGGERWDIGRKEKTFGRTNDKRRWQRKTDGGLRKWAWRGRQKPIKWAAVELINNRSIKCRVNFISRVGGLIKTWVKRGVEETRWHGRARGSPLALRLLRDAIWHSGLRGSTFSKQWRAMLTNAACFCVPISRLLFFLFPPLSFHSPETWPHSSCFTNWDQPPDKRFGRRRAGLLLIDKTISNPSGRPNLLCHRHAHLQDGQYAQEPSFFFFPPLFIFFLNWVTEFICRLPERRRGESRWVVGKWCEGASARVSVKSAVGGRKSKEKFCAFTLWRSRWEEGGFLIKLYKFYSLAPWITFAKWKSHDQNECEVCIFICSVGREGHVTCLSEQSSVFMWFVNKHVEVPVTAVFVFTLIVSLCKFDVSNASCRCGQIFRVSDCFSLNMQLT